MISTPVDLLSEEVTASLELQTPTHISNTAEAEPTNGPRRRKSIFDLSHFRIAASSHVNVEESTNAPTRMPPSLSKSFKGLLHATVRVARAMLPSSNFGENQRVIYIESPSMDSPTKGVERAKKRPQSTYRRKSLVELVGSLSHKCRSKDRILNIYPGLDSLSNGHNRDGSPVLTNEPTIQEETEDFFEPELPSLANEEYHIYIPIVDDELSQPIIPPRSPERQVKVIYSSNTDKGGASQPLKGIDLEKIANSCHPLNQPYRDLVLQREESIQGPSTVEEVTGYNAANFKTSETKLITPNQQLDGGTQHSKIALEPKSPQNELPPANREATPDSYLQLLIESHCYSSNESSPRSNWKTTESKSLASGKNIVNLTPLSEAEGGYYTEDESWEPERWANESLQIIDSPMHCSISYAHGHRETELPRISYHPQGHLVDDPRDRHQQPTISVHEINLSYLLNIDVDFPHRKLTREQKYEMLTFGNNKQRSGNAETDDHQVNPHREISIDPMSYRGPDFCEIKGGTSTHTELQDCIQHLFPLASSPSTSDSTSDSGMAWPKTGAETAHIGTDSEAGPSTRSSAEGNISLKLFPLSKSFQHGGLICNPLQHPNKFEGRNDSTSVQIWGTNSIPFQLPFCASLGPVQVSFPQTSTALGHTTLYDTRSEAIVAIYKLGCGEYDRLCTFDPMIKVIFVHVRGKFIPDAEEVEKLGLEILCLPISHSCAEPALGQQLPFGRSVIEVSLGNEKVSQNDLYPRFVQPAISECSKVQAKENSDQDNFLSAKSDKCVSPGRYPVISRNSSTYCCPGDDRSWRQNGSVTGDNLYKVIDSAVAERYSRSQLVGVGSGSKMERAVFLTQGVLRIEQEWKEPQYGKLSKVESDLISKRIVSHTEDINHDLDLRQEPNYKQELRHPGTTLQPKPSPKFTQNESTAREERREPFVVSAPKITEDDILQAASSLNVTRHSDIIHNEDLREELNEIGNRRHQNTMDGPCGINIASLHAQKPAEDLFKSEVRTGCDYRGSTSSAWRTSLKQDTFEQEISEEPESIQIHAFRQELKETECSMLRGAINEIIGVHGEFIKRGVTFGSVPDERSDGGLNRSNSVAKDTARIREEGRADATRKPTNLSLSFHPLRRFADAQLPENSRPTSDLQRNVSESSRLSLASGFRFMQCCDELAEIAMNGARGQVRLCDSFPEVSLEVLDEIKLEVHEIPTYSTAAPCGVTLEDLKLKPVGKAAQDSRISKVEGKVSGLVDIFQTHGLMPQITPSLCSSTGLNPSPFSSKANRSPSGYPPPATKTRAERTEAEGAEARTSRRAFIRRSENDTEASSAFGEPLEPMSRSAEDVFWEN